jgi:hypothetical protein
LPRKEARANIGLGDIPNETIEEIIKMKKHKLKETSKSKNEGRPPIQNKNSNCPKANLKFKKKTSEEKKAKSKEKNNKGVSAVISKKVEEIKAIMPEVEYKYEMSSSIGDFEDYLPVYTKNKYKHGGSKKTEIKTQNKTESEQHKEEQTEKEKLMELEMRKELVKMQQRAKLKKIKEEKEKERAEEERKRQNLEALNNLLKTKLKSKKKKDMEKVDDSLKFEDEEEPTKERFTLNSINQSQDAVKYGRLMPSRVSIKHKTSQNSEMTSVAHSVQSPLSKQVNIVNNRMARKRNAAEDESANASNAYNAQGRMTFDSKFTNKRGSVGNSSNSNASSKKTSKGNKQISLKKSGINTQKKQWKLSIPTVQIDKKAAKKIKKAQNYFDYMDTIPENQDVSEVQNYSTIPKPSTSLVSLNYFYSFRRLQNQNPQLKAQKILLEKC